MSRAGARVGERHARLVDLPGRGRTVVWDCPGPPGSPVLVLLHGITLTAELNWFGVMSTLSRRYRVLALDQRGHGSGLPSPAPFRLEDCADDVAAVAKALRIDRVVPVGYSMGGFVAQLVWRRHPELTAGLVLCSTARNVWDSPLEHCVSLMLPGVVNTVRLLPGSYRLGADVLGSSLLGNESDPKSREWALAQMRRTSLHTAMSAMQAACDFTSHRWISGVDVPTAVVITSHDRIVPPRRQWNLARALPGSVVYEIAGDHGVFLGSPGRFATVLARACRAVAPTSGQADQAPTLTAS